MRTALKRKWLLAGLVLLVVAVPAVIYRGLTYVPDFYRTRASVPRVVLRQEADRFVTHSLQLRNDIANEDHWEAVFSDEEVNAWVLEELVVHFRDQLPPNVHDPLVEFDLDQVTLAFQMDQGPFRSVVWVVARAKVVSDNTLALALEKIRAGAVPVPADRIIDQVTERAKAYGMDIEWTEQDGTPVALIRYSLDPVRQDLVLERVQILDGQIFISGRSKRTNGRVTQISLPSRMMLQTTFPTRRKSQGSPVSTPSGRRSSTTPVT